ncbi:hypothetical protein N9N28_15095 [Rubripirellula amarantea]|uniref:Uncharacterized protein n=1 Tax=Rubripirellula amarantea TaxID=2527999 RepID=A0A5C5WYC3_9BACT|nr:hypothetical protein [Rubripirellula amarantea]MDA8745952.1 hypothetical protein [Rubripirellula amarantea]TWT55003.1 hypothetical protein Pla22_26570 [Rubripirellula amarantea]
MAVLARPVQKTSHNLTSWLRVRRGYPCDLMLEISDSESGTTVDWSGHCPRFRVYSQLVDKHVVVEVTDPERCQFTADGLWRLKLTAEETAAMPCGGMHFTLEHGDSYGQYELGIRGGISCMDRELRVDKAHSVS